MEAWLPSCLSGLSTVESQSSSRAVQAPVPGVMPKEEAQIQERKEELQGQGQLVELTYFILFYISNI